MSTFSLNNIVNPTLRVSALPQAAKNFSIGLVLSAAQAKPGAWASGQRTASYTSEAAVAVDFGSDTPLQDFGSDTPLQHFATAYFGQSPQPASLKVGLWLTGDASATAAITACYNYDPNFYLVAVEPGTAGSDVLLVAAFCNSNGMRFFFTTQEANCLAALTSGSTNLLGQLSGFTGMTSAASTPRAMGIYTDSDSDANDIGAACLMATAATMNIGQPNSMSTFMFKQFAGIGKASLTQTQLTNIVGPFDGSAGTSWNGNVYATFGNTDMLCRGVACDGRFEDEGLGLDWLENGIQTTLFNTLQQAASAGSRIPQTDEGSARLIMDLTTFMEQAKAAGLCAPGTWKFDGVGNIETGDPLPKGYYIYAAPVSTMTSADRAARKAPPISILVCGAGAIQYAAPTIIFQR
jgi:hypothetical protein